MLTSQESGLVCPKRCWFVSTLYEPTIKANYFSSYATRKTSISEKASADLWPSWYKEDEVVATMRRNKEELIVLARKITCNP